MKNLQSSALFCTFALLFSACTPRQLAVRETAKILEVGADAIFDESDPAFAREALPAQLKMLEALLINDPTNRRLLVLAAEGFAGHAFLFLEDDQTERAKISYLRARDYALRALECRRALAGVSKADPEALATLLPQVQARDVPALFWAAFAWAGYINLSKDSSSAVAELPKAVAMMQRAHDLDGDFHFAGADLFMGVYYASRPAILGGDVKKAAAHFQEARRRTGGRFLMTYVLEARYVGVGTQDQALFKGLLAKVLESPAGRMAHSRLIDEVAKLKAAKLQEKVNDLF